MKNGMTPQQQEEIRCRLKKELLQQGERHPRISLATINEMELKEVKEECEMYAKIGEMSFYAWIDDQTKKVISVQVVERRNRKS